MLDPAGWLSKAQALPEGKRKRTTHDCGPGTVLIVDHKETGWGAWCHRCNEPGWVPKPPENLSERIERLRKQAIAEAEIERDLRPPMPANFVPTTWPLIPRVWLYKAGISNERIMQCGFYYHEPTKRVVLPVTSDGKLVYWQARGFDKDGTKYINPTVDRTKLVAKYGAGPMIVLTEDILSAVRVGEVTEAWSILGTSLPDPVLNQLMLADKPVRVWLDPDASGRKGSSKAVKALRTVGIDVKPVYSERDPKFHSKEEIASVLGLDPAAAP